MRPPRTGPPIRRSIPYAGALAGSIIAGKYRIMRAVGRGGMGTVYKAENVAIGKIVALKLLHLSLTDDDVVTQRFEREARITVSVGHPHIVEVLDMGKEPGGAPFIVMEYVRGKSLNKLVRDGGPMPVARAVRIVGQVLEALSATHACGVVHRDLKPENVLVTSRHGQPDFVKVFDFGISTFIESELARERELDLTPTGFTMTTPFYASPEQIAGAKGRDPRVDLYAVGVMLYELLSGHRPFEADNLPELCERILQGEAAPLRVFRRDVPPQLEAVVQRAMAVEPDARFQAAEEFLRAMLPFGARAPKDDDPEPTDTFTVDLRELGALAEASKAPAARLAANVDQGRAAVHGELAYGLIEHFVGSFGAPAVRRCLGEIEASGAAAAEVLDGRRPDILARDLYVVAEHLDRRFGRGDRSELAAGGRHLARRLRAGNGFGGALVHVTPELFFSLAASIWEKLFRFGEAKVVRVGRGYGRLEVREQPIPALAPAVIMLGLLEEGLRLSGAGGISARLSRSAAAGDDRDAFEATWSD